VLQNKIKTALLLALTLTACAEDKTLQVVEILPPPFPTQKPVETVVVKPEIVPPYQVPTFTGENTDWHKINPAIKPAKKFDADLIIETITNCYPVPSMHIEIGARVGTTFKPPSTGAMVQSLDASSYYAGIVATMPLYSGVEIDKEQKLAIDRKLNTATVVTTLLTNLAVKRRTERMLGLYMSLEKRSQKRVQEGIVAVDEQIAQLEKVATTQGELDAANAAIEGSRLSLIHQCKPEDVERLNNFILAEIY
jgi:hypothetical protein